MKSLRRLREDECSRRVGAAGLEPVFSTISLSQACSRRDTREGLPSLPRALPVLSKRRDTSETFWKRDLPSGAPPAPCFMLSSALEMKALLLLCRKAGSMPGARAGNAAVPELPALPGSDPAAATLGLAELQGEKSLWES